MDQIRFDFLSSVGGNTSSRSSSTPSTQTNDAFAQILDQHLMREADTATNRRATDTRSRSDASDRADTRHQQATKRRDDQRDSNSATTTATASPKSDTASAKSSAKAKQTEKAEADDKDCAKPAKKKPDEVDDKAEAANGQTTAESDGTSDSSETNAKSDTADDGTQQQGDGSQQSSDDSGDQSDTTAEADPSLLAALAVPPPPQTISGGADPSADPTAPAEDGKSAAALQAELAARLAGSTDLKAPANGAPHSQAAAGGLKFGAILKDANGQQQKATANAAAAALQDAAEGSTETPDPLTQALANAEAARAKDAKPRDAGTGTSTKPLHNAAQNNAAAAAVKSQNGTVTAAAVQPVNPGTGVTWSGTNVRNEVADSLLVGTDGRFAADDAEFSNWSQYLGANASGLSGASASRQAAFMTQLRQNLQVLPPHEQIAVQIQNAMQNGNSRVTVALHPAELGRVEVKLHIDKDKNVTATVMVDRPATLDLLQRDAKALERALQDAGLQADSGSLSFNLRDGSNQGGDAAQNGAGTDNGSSGPGGAGGTDAKAETSRNGVVAIADGYVDLET